MLMILREQFWLRHVWHNYGPLFAFSTVHDFKVRFKFSWPEHVLKVSFLSCFVLLAFCGVKMYLDNTLVVTFLVQSLGKKIGPIISRLFMNFILKRSKVVGNFGNFEETVSILEVPGIDKSSWNIVRILAPMIIRHWLSDERPVSLFVFIHWPIMIFVWLCMINIIRNAVNYL